MSSDELDQRKPDGLADDETAEEDEDVDVEDEEDDEAALASDEEEEGDQASLEELIAQRAAGRRAPDDSEEDSDIMAIVAEPDEPVVEPLPTKVAPIRDQKEFVCKSCYLVKPRVQMADTRREYCRDCV